MLINELKKNFNKIDEIETDNPLYQEIKASPELNKQIEESYKEITPITVNKAYKKFENVFS